MSQKWGTQLNSIAETTKKIHENTDSLKMDTTELLGLMKGKASSHGPDQTDAERLRQIGLQQKHLKVEADILKELECERKEAVKKEQADELLKTAGEAASSIHCVVDELGIEGNRSYAEQKAQLAEAHAAQKKALAAHERLRKKQEAAEQKTTRKRKST